MKNRMRLFCRHGVYHVEFAGGKRRSLRTSDEQTAKGIFKELEKEYLRGRLLRLDNSKRKSISEFSTHYSEHRPGISKWTVKKDLLSLKLLREAIRHPGLGGGQDIPLQIDMPVPWGIPADRQRVSEAYQSRTRLCSGQRITRQKADDKNAPREP